MKLLSHRGYVDDAGMAAPQENHFLFAVR